MMSYQCTFCFGVKSNKVFDKATWTAYIDKRWKVFECKNKPSLSHLLSQHSRQLLQLSGKELLPMLLSR